MFLQKRLLLTRCTLFDTPEGKMFLSVTCSWVGLELKATSVQNHIQCVWVMLRQPRRSACAFANLHRQSWLPQHLLRNPHSTISKIRWLREWRRRKQKKMKIPDDVSQHCLILPKFQGLSMAFLTLCAATCLGSSYSCLRPDYPHLHCHSFFCAITFLLWCAQTLWHISSMETGHDQKASFAQMQTNLDWTLAASAYASVPNHIMQQRVNKTNLNADAE